MGRFGRARELIGAGEMAAGKTLPALREPLRQRTAEEIRGPEERRLTPPTTSAQWPPLA
ncbi:MAG: hypothetical protein ABSE79_23505 [Terriglobia bacterium]|jgi:hypothetical protein